MKFLQIFSKFMKKKPQIREVFLSLILDEEGVSAAAWESRAKGVLPEVIKTVTKTLSTDSWDERSAVADTVVATLDEAVAPAKIEKVVLGLPANYLSDDGEILPETRSHIKELSKSLELTPMGFVPVHQAIGHTLKHDEGVPPTVILLGVGKKLTVSVFKVGALIGQKTVAIEDDVALQVETILKSFKDIEILPSRMLLYGGSHEHLTDVQAKLLRHPWQTKASFLHFPKIELLPTDFAVGAVCVAGATELARSMEVDIEEVPAEEPQAVTQEAQKEAASEESNVVMVNPNDLGFESRDVLEEEVTDKPQDLPSPKEEKKKFRLPTLSIPKIPFSLQLPATPRRVALVAVAGIMLLVILGSAARWVIPRAQVTVLTLPQQVESSETITIEPTATLASSQDLLIPGVLAEKTVSGESAIATSGKKKVGDPAKGAVTIFNKSTSSRILKKGAVLTANSLRFTLDGDVSVASASENLVSGTVTFGKANAAITSSDIGPQSNLPEGTEFTFSDVATSIAMARADKALSGGTSRDVVVVSRQDYDSLTKALTSDLVKKAKEELATGVDLSGKLIDETIKTEVASRDFSQEIDEEASQLQGKLTVKVTGVSYNEEDIKTLLKESVMAKMPQGYTLDETTLTSTISKVSVARDGTITVNATLAGRAIPSVDIATVQQTIAGKTISEAQEILKDIRGIAGVEFLFRFALTHNRLPVNKNNISVVVAAQ